jgi:hypothetical protein
MGPMGMGPMTGRGAGFCAGYGVPGCANPAGYGGGYGRGRGRGFGFGRMYWGPVAPWQAGYAHPAAYAEPYEMDEKEVLSRQAKYLEEELKQIKRRLDEIGEDGE